jgi:RNA polymerase sigma-70 factor (ECF subfamily)
LGSGRDIVTPLEALDLDSIAAPGRNARAEANELMERYAAGDDSVFADLYEVLAPPLYRYLVRQTKDAIRAEDLLQQTMLQIHSQRSRFWPGANVTPWAYAIARRLLINSYRRRTREAAAAPAHWTEEASSGPGADELLHSKRVHSALEYELSRLPAGQRVAFELIKKEGLSVREVAEVLGTTATAIKLRAHRAYVALRAALGEHALEGK